MALYCLNAQVWVKDMHLFCVETESWTEFDVTGTVPRTLYHSACVYVPNRTTTAASSRASHTTHTHTQTHTSASQGDAHSAGGATIPQVHLEGAKSGVVWCVMLYSQPPDTRTRLVWALQPRTGDMVQDTLYGRLVVVGRCVVEGELDPDDTTDELKCYTLNLTRAYPYTATRSQQHTLPEDEWSCKWCDGPKLTNGSVSLKPSDSEDHTPPNGHTKDLVGFSVHHIGKQTDNTTRMHNNTTPPHASHHLPSLLTATHCAPPTGDRVLVYGTGGVGDFMHGAVFRKRKKERTKKRRAKPSDVSMTLQRIEREMFRDLGLTTFNHMHRNNK